MELRGERVRLRPFRPDELDVVLEERQGLFPHMLDRERTRRRLARSGRLAYGRLDLAIEAAGQVVGEVDARQPKGAMPPGVFEIGIGLWPEAQGKGYGTEAVRLLTEHLLAQRGAARVQASTDVDNAPMRRVLEKLGFVYEGTMRSFMPDGEGRRDYALYALTR